MCPLVISEPFRSIFIKLYMNVMPSEVSIHSELLFVQFLRREHVRETQCRVIIDVQKEL